MGGGGYTDSKGRFRYVPLIPQTSINKPVEQQRFSKNMAKLLKEKSESAIKKGIERQHQKRLDKEKLRINTKAKIDEVLRNDSESLKEKFHRIQGILLENHKNLTSEDLKLYNQRLREIHQQMVRPPQTTNTEMEQPREEDLHEDDSDVDEDKLSPESKAEVLALGN